MRGISELRERLRSVCFRAREEEEMEEEIRFHLQMETERLVREQGLRPGEAHRRARLAFGGMQTHREEIRAARGLGWADVWARDVRYALRGLRLHPVFALTLVLTLALGIGAAVTMFSIVDALLLRPLPYGDAGRLVSVEAVTPRGDTRPYIGWEAAHAWGERSEVFASSMAHARQSLLFTGGGEPRTLVVEGVTPDFEEVLGVRPALGRGLYPEDADPASPAVVVLDHAFWRSAFGADRGVIGRVMELEGEPHRIVGVMPEGFKFPMYATTELWMPIRADGTLLGAPADRVALLGRVGGEPLEVVQGRADAAALALAQERPREQGWAVRLRPLAEGRAANPALRQAVWFLAGAVALLLLVAGVNATSLLLVRGWSRARELAVRVALGASRRRVAGQLLTESVLLAALSGFLAVLLALLGLRAIRDILPESISFFAPHAIEMEWRALAFALAVAAAAGVLVGVVPALRATRLGSAAAQAGLTPYAARTHTKSRLRRTLVVGEISLSVMLLIGAGLLIHSFVRLVGVDPGFRTENIAVMRLNLSEASYPSPAARADFLQRLERRLEALPGVEGVAVNGGVPPAGGFSFGVNLQAEGAEPPAEQPQLLPTASVPPDFFDVLEVRVLAGRALTGEDAGTDHVVIDRPLARFLWGAAEPVGRRFRTGPESDWLTVVGVVGELRMMGPDDRRARFGILYPLAPGEAPSYVPLAIRAREDPRPLFRSFRAAVHGLDPRQPIEELRPASELYAETIDMQRFLLVLMSTLSALELLLAAAGIYGVLGSGVIQRRRELGIRIALGAPLRRVRREVLREGLLLAGIGAVVGTAMALWLSRLIQGLLYGVAPTDPGTIAVVVVVTLAAAVVACYGPARRATRVDPVEALRVE